MKDRAEYIKQHLNRPLVLAGMMGAGKTYVGRLLADALDLDFIDSDAVIEGKAGCSIPEIFERDGEGKFRAVEAATVAECLERGPLVLSTGGGALMNQQTLAAVKSRAFGVWVQAGMDDMLSRVSGRTNRPLLNTGDPRRVLEELLERRRPYYEQMPIHVLNEDGKSREAVESILKFLEKLLSP